MMHGTKNSTGEPKCYSCGCSYCTSLLMQCRASTANSLMFSELYRCTINSNSVCDTRWTFFSQDKLSGSEITPCRTPGAAFECISPSQVTSETRLSVQSVSDGESPFSHQSAEVKKSCVCCDVAASGSISCSGSVRLQTCTSVCMLQPGGDPLPHSPSGLWEHSAVA